MVVVYGLVASAPVRAVRLVLDVVGKDYEFKDVDLTKGEHKTPEFLKINPQHNIPAIQDGDFAMNESRAILCYLASVYGDEKLYPKDPKVRAKVDQRLYFDMGSFYEALGKVMYPKMFEGKDPTAATLDRLKEVLGWVNDMVKETGYAAGTAHLTVADLAFLATYSSIAVTIANIVDLSSYTELSKWFEKVKGEVKNYEKANGEGAAQLGEFYKSKVQ